MFGPLKERKRFLNEHVKADFDNIVEILLRLVRREGFAPNTPLPPNPLVPSTFSYAPQQTAASMAVFSLFKMSVEYALKAEEDIKILEGRVGHLIRSLPQSQVLKSLDGMFKDWTAAQKKLQQQVGNGTPRP